MKKLFALTKVTMTFTAYLMKKILVRTTVSALFLTFALSQVPQALAYEASTCSADRVTAIFAVENGQATMTVVDSRHGTPERDYYGSTTLYEPMVGVDIQSHISIGSALGRNGKPIARMGGKGSNTFHNGGTCGSFDPSNMDCPRHFLIYSNEVRKQKALAYPSKFLFRAILVDLKENTRTDVQCVTTGGVGL